WTRTIGAESSTATEKATLHANGQVNADGVRE
ncbi:MAG: hypothetical protein ACI9WU_001978, partial [Myxococcota bacterium]